MKNWTCFSLIRIIAFDHRKCMLSRVPSEKDYLWNLIVNLNTENSSTSAVYEYFSAKLVEMQHTNVSWASSLFTFLFVEEWHWFWEASFGMKDGVVACLLDPRDRDCVETVLKYIKDGDLRRWKLPDTRAFNVGLSEWRSKLNCLTNPDMYQQVWTLRFDHLICWLHLLLISLNLTCFLVVTGVKFIKLDRKRKFVHIF